MTVAHVADAGLVALARFTALEELDLECSAVTDVGLRLIAARHSLRWVDLTGAAGVTRDGLARLRRARPDVEVEPDGVRWALSHVTLKLTSAAIDGGRSAPVL